jgi:hypothetical protein
VVVRASSRIPHSVAKGPPEWSHETCSSSPDRRGVGIYATNGCIALPGRLEGATHRRETSITTLPTYAVPSTLCTEFPRVHFGGFGSNSSLEAESAPRDGNPSPKANCRRGEFGNQGGRHKVHMTCRQRCQRCSNIRAVKWGERRYASNGSAEEDPSEDEEHNAGAVRAPSCKGKHLLHLAS